MMWLLSALLLNPVQLGTPSPPRHSMSSSVQSSTFAAPESLKLEVAVLVADGLSLP